MVKSLEEEIEIPAPRRKKDEQTKTWLNRAVGSVWHYALALVFAAAIGMGIWSRSNWMAETMNSVALLGLAGAGMMMCFAMTKVSKNQALALIVAVVYMAAPYLLDNIYTRMSLAEGAVMMAEPILLLGLYQLTAHEKRAVRYLAVAAAMMILANGVWAAIWLAVAAIYILLNVEKAVNIGVIWRMILAAIVTLGLAAGFVVPLVETWLGWGETLDAGYVTEYFGEAETSGAELNAQRVRPQELINFDYARGNYRASLGIIALVGIVGFWFAWRMIEKKSERRFVTTLYLIGMIAIVAASVAVNWEWMPGATWMIREPMRFLSITAATMSVVAGYTMFAPVQRMTAAKQAGFALVIGAIAVGLVAQIIMPGGALDEAAMRGANVAMMAVGEWINMCAEMIQGIMTRGYKELSPAEIGMLVSLGAMGLGAIWVMVSNIREWHRKRKQKQVDSLIDSVWEAMAETESVRNQKEKKKKKTMKAEKPQAKLLPEPPEPEVPELKIGNNETSAAGVTSDTMVIPTETKPTKKAARKRKSTKKNDDTEKRPSAKKTTRTTVRSATTTAKVKHIKASAEAENEEAKPRVTKVKAGSKK